MSSRYRKTNSRLKRIEVKPYPRGFFRWMPNTWRVSDAEFYQQVMRIGQNTKCRPGSTCTQGNKSWTLTEGHLRDRHGATDND